MKLTVIGGGGVRSMFLAKSIAQNASALGIKTLVFMDNDRERLQVYGVMARHVGRMLCPDLKFVLTDDPVEAVRCADYVITTIRVGGDHMRVRDERLALAHNVLGQETTGAAGVSFAMRSIPALAGYCELIKKHAAPNVKVFNFTNPAGVVSQALRDMGYTLTFGICDAPSGLLRQIAGMLDVSPESLCGECYGLNHLSYFSSITMGGREVLPELMEMDELYHATDQHFFSKDLVRSRNAILNEYLYYYYYREQVVEHIQRSGMTRGEAIEEINRSMTAALSQLDVDVDFERALEVFETWYGKRENAYMASETGMKREGKPWSFDVFGSDAGGYAGVALRYIEIERSGKRGSMILCCPNNGAIPLLEDGDVVEVTCDVSAGGCVPHRFGIDDIPEGNLELIRRVKYYERVAARGIVNRSKSDIIECLAMHPLVSSYSIAVDLAESYIELNKDYIDGWAS